MASAAEDLVSDGGRGAIALVVALSGLDALSGIVMPLPATAPETDAEPLWMFRVCCSTGDEESEVGRGAARGSGAVVVAPLSIVGLGGIGLGKSEMVASELPLAAAGTV